MLFEEAVALNDDLQNLLTGFSANNQQDCFGDIVNQYGNTQTSMASLRSSLATMAQTRLQDTGTVLTPLAIQGNNIQTIIAALITQMATDSQTIRGNVCAVGSPTYAAANVGTGIAIPSIVLDGVNSPRTGMNAHIRYNGVNSQVALNETMTLVCTQDSYSDGRTAGQESFQWTGGVPLNNIWSAGNATLSDYSEGSGIGPVIQTLNASSIVLNRDFETFTVSNTPDNWTLTGTAGTHILRESSNVFRGTYSVKFLGNGSQATIGLTQAMTVANLKPRQRYCLSFWYKASAVDTASQDLTVKFTGTGYTASASEKVVIAGNAYATGWTEQHFFINLPANLPNDFTLSIMNNGTPNSGKAIYIDSLSFGPVSWFGGQSAVVIAGQTNFVRGDRIQWVNTNDGQGKFAEFFRKAFQCQLPAVTDGTQTVTDNYCE